MTAGELERNTVGGNPRSLEFSEGKEVEEVTREEEEGTHRVAKELGRFLFTFTRTNIFY